MTAAPGSGVPPEERAMPLTPKGRRILQRMQEEYGEAKGKAVFHASRNKGRIGGVELAHTPVPSGRGKRKPP